MFDKLGGRKFIAWFASFCAYIVAVVGIYTLDQASRYNALIAAAGILTAASGLYVAGNAYVKGREPGSPPGPAEDEDV